MATAILAFSGGLASTALLWELRSLGHCVHCVFVDYGQANLRKEMPAAEQLAGRANQRRKEGQEVDFSCLAMAGLGPSPLPTHGVVRRHDFEFFGLQVLAMAAGKALATEGEILACGTHVENTVPGFEAQFANLLALLNRGKLGFFAPFTERNAGWIVSHATQLGAPLTESWSCLLAGAIHCGTCRGCRARQKGFALAGIPDFTLYTVPVPREILPFVRRPGGTA